MVLIGSQATVDRLKRRAETVDDQIEALAPLTPGVLAKLAGYAGVESLSVKRHRSAKLTPEQLRRIGKGLQRLAATAEQMARREEKHGPVALKAVLVDIVTNLGGMASDDAAATTKEDRTARPLRRVVSAVKTAGRRARAAEKRRSRGANENAIAELETAIAARPPSRKSSPWGTG